MTFAPCARETSIALEPQCEARLLLLYGIARRNNKGVVHSICVLVEGETHHDDRALYSPSTRRYTCFTSRAASYIPKTHTQNSTPFRTYHVVNTRKAPSPNERTRAHVHIAATARDRTTQDSRPCAYQSAATENRRPSTRGNGTEASTRGGGREAVRAVFTASGA